MNIYTCPHKSHRGHPAPLAEDSSGVYSCVKKHKYKLINDPDTGYVFRDIETNILHEAQVFNFDELQYYPEKLFNEDDLENASETDAGKKSPSKTEKSVKPESSDTAEKKKVIKVKTSSVLYINPDVDLNNITLSPLEWKLFSLIDGRTRVNDIVLASKIDEKQALGLLASFIKRGVVGIREKGE